MKLKERAALVVPGKFYVGKKSSWLVREIMEEVGNDNIYWRSYLYDTGEPFDYPHMCSKRAIVMWAEREATPDEITRMQCEKAPKYSPVIEKLVEFIPELLMSESEGKGRYESSIMNRGHTYGLFIGVNEYEQNTISNLSVCASDVSAISKILKDDCRAYTLLTDNSRQLPTRLNILKELSTLTHRSNSDDLIVFYFSGHGYAENGQSYLLPRDVDLSLLRYTAISIKDIQELLQNADARAKVIIIDACHSGASLGRGVKSLSNNFFQHVFDEAEGITILASCKQGEVSWEWKEKNCSVFTFYLIEALRGSSDHEHKGFVTISDVNRYLTDRLKQWSIKNSKRQTPTMQAEMVGDIILRRLSNG